jgi:hypothetical protein
MKRALRIVSSNTRKNLSEFGKGIRIGSAPEYFTKTGCTHLF